MENKNQVEQSHANEAAEAQANEAQANEVFEAAEALAHETHEAQAPTQAPAKPAKSISAVRIAKMGMLVAISVVLVYFIHFPIIPAVPFMEYDPSQIPTLLGTFAFGPLAGVLITIVTATVQGFTVSAASGLYGILMHIVATCTFVIVAGILYKRNKTRKGAVIALVCGTIAMTVVMGGANMVITPIFMGVPSIVVWDLMPAILAFNLIKASINSLITFLCYKRLSGFLHRQ